MWNQTKAWWLGHFLGHNMFLNSQQLLQDKQKKKYKKTSCSLFLFNLLNRKKILILSRWRDIRRVFKILHKISDKAVFLTAFFIFPFLCLCICKHRFCKILCKIEIWTFKDINLLWHKLLRCNSVYRKATLCPSLKVFCGLGIYFYHELWPASLSLLKESIPTSWCWHQNHVYSTVLSTYSTLCLLCYSEVYSTNVAKWGKSLMGVCKVTRHCMLADLGIVIHQRFIFVHILQCAAARMVTRGQKQPSVQATLSG